METNGPADYVVTRRVELSMRDRRAFAEATGVTEQTLGKLENGHTFPQAPSVWSRPARLDPGFVATDPGRRGTEGRVAGASGMPSMRTRRCGASRALRDCLPTWFAASLPSPGTGGKATMAQMTRPSSALDRWPRVLWFAVPSRLATALLS